MVVGLSVGTVVSAYRYCVENSALLMDAFYKASSKNWWMTLLLFMALTVAGLFCGWLVQDEHFISGSGVPQTQIEINEQKNYNWLKLLLYKFMGGVLCLGAGLSLGREGPSVQIGSLVGASIKKQFGRDINFRLLFGCGAGAGLSAALNAPLAGTMFAIEELYKELSPITLVSLLLSSIASTMVTEKIFGIAPLIKITQFPVPDVAEYILIVGIGICAGIFGALFSRSFLLCYDRCKNINWRYKFIGIFAITGFFGMAVPSLLGVREGLFATTVMQNELLLWLVALFFLKWLFTMASMLSNAPGGIFVPLLGLGILLGLIIAKLCTATGMTTDSNMIMVLVMGGYFTAVIRTPLTAIALTAELTDSFVCFLPLACVCVVSMLASDFMGARPIYEEIIERSRKET